MKRWTGNPWRRFGLPARVGWLIIGGYGVAAALVVGSSVWGWQGAYATRPVDQIVSVLCLVFAAGCAAWAARFAAVRVTPAHDWRDRRLAPEVWRVGEQDLGATPRTKYFFVDLPAKASVKQLVSLAHQRWAIEQPYQELKTELGFDHFEGRSYPRWQQHVVLTAVAYAFLQNAKEAK